MCVCLCVCVGGGGVCVLAYERLHPPVPGLSSLLDAPIILAHHCCPTIDAPPLAPHHNCPTIAALYLLPCYGFPTIFPPTLAALPLFHNQQAQVTPSFPSWALPPPHQHSSLSNLPSPFALASQPPAFYPLQHPPQPTHHTGEQHDRLDAVFDDDNAEHHHHHSSSSSSSETRDVGISNSMRFPGLSVSSPQLALPVDEGLDLQVLPSQKGTGEEEGLGKDAMPGTGVLALCGGGVCVGLYVCACECVCARC